MSVAALEEIQRRAATEPRDHLVALVEYAFKLPIAQAERLIPRGGIRADAMRDDCANPIRDENGMFLGCEPGEGGSSGGGEGGKPSSEGKEAKGSTPAADRPRSARISELRDRIKITPAEQAKIEEDTGWYANPEEREAAEEKALKGIEERRAGDALAAKVRKRGHLLDIPTEKKDAHRAAVAVIDGKRDEVARAWEKEREEIATILADVKELDGDDGETDDAPDDVFASMAEFTGTEDGGDLPSSAITLPDFYEEDDPGDFEFNDEDVEEGESAAAAKKRQQSLHAEQVSEFEKSRKAYDEAKAKLPGKVKEARDRLLAFSERNAALVDEFKQLDKAEAKARRASEKEGEYDSVSDLIDKTKFPTFDEDAGEPSDFDEAAAYNEAYDAASHLIDNDDREDITSSVDASSLKAASKAAASMAKNLTKYLVRNGHEKAAPKKPTAKKPAKAKAAAEPEDIDEDEEEEDADEE